MKRGLRYGLGALGAAALVSAAATGCGAASTVTKTVTKNVPVPGETKTVTNTVTAPGPTVTATDTVTAPPPPQGSVIDTFHGTGNQVTPSFNVPADGNYIVTWSYSGNVDNSLGSDQATNFSISETGSGDGGDLPNDIATSGSGSTEITGAGSTDSLNVEAAGQWTIKIKSA